MIRYNNILRPVHDPLRPPCDPPTTTYDSHNPPAQNLGVATPNPPGLTPMRIISSCGSAAWTVGVQYGNTHSRMSSMEIQYSFRPTDTFVIILDMSAAFETLDHNILIQSLPYSPWLSRL